MSHAAAIALVLVDQGVTVGKEQAALLGEHPVQWSRYLKGRTDPGCAKVQGWLQTAENNGYKLAIWWPPSGPTCELIARVVPVVFRGI